MKKATRVNHPPVVELPPDNHPVVAPIYQSVKFEFDTVEETERYLRGERPGFYYSRASNPTTRQLEQLLAELQGRDDCLVTATGVGRDLAGPARAHQSGRSRHRLHRKL